MESLTKGICDFINLSKEIKKFSDSIFVFCFVWKCLALRISLIQMKIGKNKLENVTHAINSIRKTVENDKPKVVALPECFN